MCRFGVATQPSSSTDVPESDAAEEMWDVGSSTEDENKLAWDVAGSTNNDEAAVAEETLSEESVVPEVTVLEIGTAEEASNGASSLAGEVGMKYSSAACGPNLGVNCLFVVCLLVGNMNF